MAAHGLGVQVVPGPAGVPPSSVHSPGNCIEQVPSDTSAIGPEKPKRRTADTHGAMTILWRHRRAAVAVAWLGSFSMLTSGASADPLAPPALKTRLVSVALFKNGLGFITRAAELPAGQGIVLIEGLPAPAHGTFWVHALDSGAAIRDVVAFERETVGRIEATSVQEIIEANVGQTVDLRLGDKETVHAKIVSVPTDRGPDPPRSNPGRFGYDAGAYATPPQASSLVILQSSGGTMAVNKNAVLQVSSASGALKTTIERRKRTVTLRLRAERRGGPGRIAVAYMAKGITWAPSCAIDITDARKARLTARAEIIDEIEDLDGAQVNLVTGFPNLKFADVIDPIAMRGDLAAFLNSVSNPAPGGSSGYRGAVMQQAVLSNARMDDESMFPAYASGPLEGQTMEELFFYPQSGVTLRQGERGYYPLYTAEVPYEHLYEWHIEDALDQQDQYRTPEAEPEKAEEVWHSIRLTNSSRVPWTTAPALTMQGGQVLGQDLIHYTSPGGKTTVKITKAVDIKAERAESETARQRNAASFYGTSYDLVEVHGKLEAVNYKDKGITLTITKELSGEVLASSPAAKVAKTAKGLKQVNPKSALTWELPVRSRARVEIDYGYKVYVRAY